MIYVMEIGVTDLPTPLAQSHANLEVLKNKPKKTWRLGPQTFRLQKCVSNKNNDRLLVLEYS